MNRPLEFRVWTGTKMEYNIVAGRDGVFYAKIHPRDSACLEPTSRYELDTPVMQFTGFRDAFGGKIFEGDILNQLLDNKPCYYIVEWGNQADYCGFVLRPIMKRDGTSRTTVHDFQIYLAKGFEIIGNIFETSELLKKP